MYLLFKILAALWTTLLCGLALLLLAGFVGYFGHALYRRLGWLVLSMVGALGLAAAMIFLSTWTCILFPFLGLNLIILVRFRRAWAPWVLPFCALSLASLLIGFWLISTLILFPRAADSESRRLFLEMRPEQGASAPQFLARFGMPYTGDPRAADAIWYYDANPWYMLGWMQIRVNVAHGNITTIGLDDF